MKTKAKSGLNAIVTAIIILMVSRGVYAVPRDVLVHRDGKTRVEGTIVEETAETIVIQTRIHDKPLHFRKADLAQVIRGFDPEAQQTTAPEQPPSYDYRVYVPQGPVDPLRPVQPIVIAELIRRGLTPPPATPALTRTPAGLAESPSPIPSATAAPAPSVSPVVTPTPTSIPRPIVASPEPVVERREPLATPSGPAQAAMPTVPTAITTPLPPAAASLEPTSVGPAPEPAVTAFPSPSPVQMPGTPVGATVQTPLPVSSDSLLAKLLPTGQAVPTVSSASYVVGASPTPSTPRPEVTVSKETAKLQLVQGTVQCKRGGASMAVAAGASLSVGDTVETGGNGTAAVRLSSAYLVIVGPDSAVTFLKGDEGTVVEVGLVKGLVWVVGDASASLPSITIAASGCGVTPDPAEITRGVGFRVAVSDGGKIVVSTQAGRLLVEDSVVDSSFSVERGKPVAYLPGSKKAEPLPDLSDTVEKEWATVRSTFSQTPNSQ
ncbi:MAG: hypothetical protein N2Z21_08365 [Candidatus Sumerlaeaceae bacterium]|nr:hypothetical protein [Candidatus Sumerlaeaceae bacterium]